MWTTRGPPSQVHCEDGSAHTGRVLRRGSRAKGPESLRPRPPGHPPKHWLIRLLSAPVRQCREAWESRVGMRTGLVARSCTSSLVLCDGAKPLSFSAPWLPRRSISVTTIVVEWLRDTNGLWGEPHSAQSFLSSCGCVYWHPVLLIRNREAESSGNKPLKMQNPPQSFPWARGFPRGVTLTAVGIQNDGDAQSRTAFPSHGVIFLVSACASESVSHLLRW